MNAIAPRTSVSEVRTVLTPQTFDQLIRFAELAANTDMVAKDYRGKPGNIMLACQMGSELGLSPMQSLQSIAVINGRPGLFGDGLIGICRQSPLCQDIAESISGEGDARTATCVATRRGSSPSTSTFSVADAKRAGLWGKSGPWTQYPDRMLQNRARGFALRDAFPDLLRGLKTVEELRDTPPDTFRGTTIEATPPDARAAMNAEIDGKAMDRRAQVYATPSPAPAKRTARDLINEIKVQLDDAGGDIDAVDAVAGSDVVQKALAWFQKTGKTTALDELNALLADAIERVNAKAEEASAAEPTTGELIDDVIPF